VFGRDDASISLFGREQRHARAPHREQPPVRVAHGKQRQVPERRHEQHRVRARRRELQPVDNIVPKSSFKVYGHAPLPSLDPEDAMQPRGVEQERNEWEHIKYFYFYNGVNSVAVLVSVPGREQIRNVERATTNEDSE
jgi:hypothetical protein